MYYLIIKSRSRSVGDIPHLRNVINVTRERDGTLTTMHTEIEAKFLNMNHEAMRIVLEEANATLEAPRRLMRRAIIHTPAMDEKDAFLRVRDEGHRTTMTYKQFADDSVDGAREHEVLVSDFDTALKLLDTAGLRYDAYQETCRENWRLGEVEIMLDEWPWLNPFIEIEGPSEEAIKRVATVLGLDWDDAVYGGVANAYAEQYPHIGEAGKRAINKWRTIKFDDAPPYLLQVA